MYLVFVPVPGTELLKPWEFPRADRGVFCDVNEDGEPTLIRLELSVPPSDFRGGEKVWKCSQ